MRAYRRCRSVSHGASVGFCHATWEVVLAHPFEGEETNGTGSIVNRSFLLGFTGTGSSPSCPYLRALADDNERATCRE